jgi:hypothetical protein
MVQAGLPVIDFASIEDVIDEVEWERRSGQLAAGAPAGRRRRLHHAVELPAAPDLGQGRRRVRRRLHRRCSSRPSWCRASPTCSPRSWTRSACRRRLQPRAGTGPVVGEAIVKHELVDMVSFTGSTRAGRRVAELAAAGAQAHSLELGGKSASVLLDDLSADEMGTRSPARSPAASSTPARPAARPRACSSARRLPEVEGLLEVFAQFAPVGDPMSPDTQQGPLVSKVQQERVREYITQRSRRRQARRRRPGAAGGDADRASS